MKLHRILLNTRFGKHEIGSVLGKRKWRDVYIIMKLSKCFLVFVRQTFHINAGGEYSYNMLAGVCEF